MPTLDEQLDAALVKITEVDSRTESLIALFKNTKQQLQDALGGLLTPAIQAKLDSVFASLANHAADVDEALNTNVPPPTP